MNKDLRQKADFLYLILAGLFVASLVTCNLIANKFVVLPINFMGYDELTAPFVVSAGILPYPITFLITDLLSEFYGKRKTNKVVFVGFLASMLVLLFLWLGNAFPSAGFSPVSDDEFEVVFSNSFRIIAASMVAYLTAQLVDIRLFHFWKKLTNGKHLWLRNNASTILSQLVDTTLVVCVLFVGVLEFEVILGYIFAGWIFKTACALVDTPVLYLADWIIRKKFRLKPGQEMNY
jgi:uncharacterized integral membrane protein (TIGR00697 family)